MTRNTNIGTNGYYVWNVYDLNNLLRNYWRTSLVPAPAVIPAPIAYVKVAAFKKLVVGIWDRAF